VRRSWSIIFTIIGCIAAFQPETASAAAKDKGGPEQRPPAEKNWQIGFNASYSSGNFGTDTTSQFLYAPWSIRRLFRDGDVSLVIPFVALTSDGTTTLVGGQPTQTRPESCLSNSGSGKVEDRPECQAFLNGGSTGSSQRKTVTNAGLGDIILKGRYYAIEEKDYVPLIALTARMKFPTADESQGLGTGAFDHGYGIELSKMLGEKWIAFLDGGYNFIGDPDGRELQNQYWFDVGGGHYFIKDLLVSVYYEEYRSLVASLVNIRDVFFAFNYRASAEWRFNGGVMVGVSNGAPDYSLSLGTSYRF
jgi:hypothetical protein